MHTPSDEQWLQRVQIREQILNVLRVQSLAIARHFIAAKPDDVGNALVVGRQTAERKIFVLEYSLQPGPLFPAAGIGLVATVAAVVVDSAPGRLLRIEAKFGVGLAALDIASHGYREQD